MPFPKHEDNNGKRKKKAAQPQPATTAQALPDSADLSGLEVELAGIAESLRSYAINAATGENSLKLFTGPEGSGYHPVLIALDPCSESTENILNVAGRIATAFERIADALEHKPAAYAGEAKAK